MNKIRTIFAIATLCVGICGATLGPLLLGGCAHKLEPGGAYAPADVTITVNPDGTFTTNSVAVVAPDFAFYAVDSAFSVAYAAADTAFTFERENRAALWRISPDIKHTLDRLRPQAVDVRNKYIAARTAYVSAPTPANLTTLQTFLSQMKTASAAAAAALPHN